ncbi:MAG: DUF4352 domain-containing protein [Blautia sp.]|nr:DUF4352 domain-containing protein [Blautia sp.]
MKKGKCLLSLAIMAALLLGGCGTPLYELTDEEEDLIVQSAAYMTAKHNIFQKDGMNNARPKVQDDTEASWPQETEAAEEEDSWQEGVAGGSGGESSAAQGGEVSLAESIGYKDRLTVAYEGFSLMDIYQEEGYFSLNAGEGNTFVVMRFTLKNPEDEELTVSNFGKGYAFYLRDEGVEHIAEKQSIIADSLASFEGTIPANGSAEAVLIFEITKEQAELISAPKLTVEYENTAYSVSL